MSERILVEVAGADSEIPTGHCEWVDDPAALRDFALADLAAATHYLASDFIFGEEARQRRMLASQREVDK